MKSLTKEKRYDLIDAFNSISRHLDDLLNIDNIHFEHMVHRIYPTELQLNKANASDTEAAFLDLNLSIHNDFNNRNKFLTANLLKQGYRYHKLRKAFSKVYRRHFELIEKYHANLKNLCNKVFVIQKSMESWYINLRKSLEIQTSLIFSNVS